MTDRSRELTAQARAVAEEQAMRIVRYWERRGYSISAEVRTLDFNQSLRYSPSAVVTDLVNGLPKDWKGRCLS